MKEFAAQKVITAEVVKKFSDHFKKNGGAVTPFSSDDRKDLEAKVLLQFLSFLVSSFPFFSPFFPLFCVCLGRAEVPIVQEHVLQAQSQAAITMQAHWRRKQAMQRAEFLKKNRAEVAAAVTDLQAVLRGHLERQRLVREIQV